MTIYLPIAEMSVDVFLILAMGGAIGFLSGIFGVGGGFLMTPLLIFIGVPPTVAVTTGANQILASSVSGVLAHMRRDNVDLKIGAILTIGGFAGTGAGAPRHRAFQAERNDHGLGRARGIIWRFSGGVLGRKAEQAVLGL